MRSRRRSSWIVSLVIAALAGAVVPAAATPGGTPRLELLTGSTNVDVFKYGDRRVWLDLGIVMASHDAPFEIRVARASYDDPIRVFQAFHRPGGVHLEELPADIVDGWFGLRDFFRFEIRDHEGRLIRGRDEDWCPASWEGQRVDDRGPYEQTYPQWCSSHPLSLGTVWGIDRGWAIAPELGGMSIRLDDGRYRADLWITDRYRTLFDIPDEDASVTVSFRVRTVEGCRFCAPAAPATLGDASAPRQTALTQAVTMDHPPVDTLPDLVALPSFWIWPDRQHRRDYLTFGANVWNRGPAPLVIEGFRAEGEDRMDAYQYFFRDGEIVGRAPVGSFEFDRRTGHYHWHFQQFARYRLLDESRTDVVLSHKQSFCLGPTDGIDLTVDGASLRQERYGFTRCGGVSALWIREVLPAGWGDTYFQWMGGQSFNITDVPNGTYWIEVAADPTGALFDADPTNDVEYRKVILGGSPGARTVSVPPWHGIDTEGGF